MSSELSADGKAAILGTRTVNTLSDRQRARRKAAELVLAANDPHQALRELLNQLDLQPQPGEPH
jgi:hypothetical protein